mgnify:CR=1 FL=1
MTDDDESVGIMVHITLPAAHALNLRIIDESVERGEAVSRALVTYDQLRQLCSNGWQLRMLRSRKPRWWEFWKAESAWIPVDLNALAAPDDALEEEMFWRTAP